MAVLFGGILLSLRANTFRSCFPTALLGKPEFPARICTWMCRAAGRAESHQEKGPHKHCSLGHMETSKPPDTDPPPQLLKTEQHRNKSLYSCRPQPAHLQISGTASLKRISFGIQDVCIRGLHFRSSLKASNKDDSQHAHQVSSKQPENPSRMLMVSTCSVQARSAPTKTNPSR
ncbi:uncharacterized protein LOC107053945 isoform X1 [Gallus gallus]|uniref:uncharacterized protein LOC107053945 isoform X1 n=1 Tax=Gallus gallus TaxID=9031 RepID=UPI001AE9D2D4|nr:uncharacterized protein LOC107053945 isoform X1 [Gallus gallus]